MTKLEKVLHEQSQTPWVACDSIHRKSPGKANLWRGGFLELEEPGAGDIMARVYRIMNQFSIVVIDEKLCKYTNSHSILYFKCIVWPVN